MGIDSKRAPPLPAPTEESSSPSELALTPTDVSRPGDEQSTYSLPDDGSPITIRTRSKSNKQTSLLIEYSDYQAGTSGAEADRRPSVRVRVTTPSAKGKNGAGHIQIAETTDPSYKPTHSRRSPLSPLTPSQPSHLRDGEDDQSIGSYASATEESNVSRNQPVDIGIDIGRAGRRRRPASPLIPQPNDTMASLMPSTQSEISAIPTDSFLDGSGPTRSSDDRWMSSSNSAEKLKNTKIRTVSRERVKISSSDKKDRSERKHKSSKSRTSSASDKYADEIKSPRRRSSRNHESAVSAADSSVISSSFSPSHRSMDQHSMRSESSSKSINNPKLLEAVEDAIRRLILPELDSLRREQSLRETARRGSVVSTGTSISREDLLSDRRKTSERTRDPRYKGRRDREGRHDYADASPRFDRDSMDGSSILEVEPQTPRRKSTDVFKTAAAAAVGGLAAAALTNSPSDDKKQRRRKRAESVRSRSGASDTYTDDFDDDDHFGPSPPMPLMSEINPSEVTRASILSAETDRPHSATEEAAPHSRGFTQHEVSPESTPTPTRTSNALRDTLGTQHANISHGDLTVLRSKIPDDDVSDQHVGYTRGPPTMHDPVIDEPEVIPPESAYVSSAYDYYNTQDVPPPLRYEPYQPERRGLSPIYSVSGYTEAGSEGPQQRDSRTFAPSGSQSDSPEKSSQRGLSIHSPGSVHSHVMGGDYDQKSDGRSSVADYRRTMSVDGSDLDAAAVSRQAVQGIGANPNIVHVPVGLESHVASLIDGSMIDQSVLSQDFGARDSTISYGEGSRSYADDRSSPAKKSIDSYRYAEGERAITPASQGHQQRSLEDRSTPVKQSTDSYRYAEDERVITPASQGHQQRSLEDHSSPAKQSIDSYRYTEDERAIAPAKQGYQQRSREFAEEYDLDKYGRKVLTSQYRQSPTESEAAITASAAAKAIKALKANQDRQINMEGEFDETFVPAGVQRNKSFKERTLAGHEPATTPTHSIDRLDYVSEPPRLGASGLPDLDDPMPEIGYVDDSDTHTNASVVRERLDGADDAASWAARSLQTTPKPYAVNAREGEHGEASERQGLGITDMATAAALGTAAAMATGHSHQLSNDRDEDWQRTSDERKRDTLGTNPFEGISPVADPQLGDSMFRSGNYGTGFHTGSPGGPLEDEGYKSQGPNRTPDFDRAPDFSQTPDFSRTPDFNRTPDFQAKQDVMALPKAVELRDGEDPFYEPSNAGHPRHFSGLSHGMTTPFYDAATGGGIDRIESKDIVALMQELVARDAQRTARDTEIAATVMFLAKEMRISFKSVENRIRQAEDVLADELQETEKAIVKTIGGPRPFPGSAGRSIQGSQAGEDLAVKKGNIIRRALKGLKTSGTNDLTRIEDMLLTLLKDVDDLKTQTAEQSRNTTRPSLDNLLPEVKYEQDPGYDPEGRDEASMASQATHSGHLSVPQSRPLQRQYSENRVSTVPEGNEDEHDLERDQQDGARYGSSNLLTPAQSNQRGSSVPLETPPQTGQPAHSGTLSNDNTPRTERGKKHKSSSSSSWIPKISRWSETTASTVSKAFRGNNTPRKDRETEYMQHPAHSRSGSDLGTYADDYHNGDMYDGDYLHTGHSEPNLAPPNPQHLDLELPRLQMTPEDPKYKAHRNSLNLQHPQPRPGQTERFKATLESQAYTYDSSMTPKSHDWHGSTSSLHRLPAQQHAHRYSDTSAQGGEYWADSTNSGPPRPPKEPIENASGTPGRGARPSKLSKTSPLPYHSVESGYGTATATQTNYTGSPKLENRNLSGALGIPTRRPSGPRAMTPKSAEEDAAREERRRKRDTFGTVASQDTDTF